MQHSNCPTGEGDRPATSLRRFLASARERPLTLRRPLDDLHSGQTNRGLVTDSEGSPTNHPSSNFSRTPAAHRFLISNELQPRASANLQIQRRNPGLNR
jgi:hypothetical protein